jgi:hypothetical protein
MPGSYRQECFYFPADSLVQRGIRGGEDFLILITTETPVAWF